MFRLQGEQKVAQIGKVKIGGQPGENPPALIGSIFYVGHKILEKPRKHGKFDRAQGEALLKAQEELSDKTGLPHIVDIVALLPEEFPPLIDFVADKTEAPIALDAYKIPTKIAGARHAVEVGLTGRLIYNSLSPWSENIAQETAEIRRLGLKTCITVAYNPADKTTAGRINLLKEDLLPKAREAGFTQILIDTTVLNAPSMAFSLTAARRIKGELGLPVGCSPGNASDSWRGLKANWGRSGFIGVDSACHGIASLLWSNFLLYGPMENSSWIFPAVAASSVILATFLYEEGGSLPDSPNHPLEKLFPDFLKELRGGGGR